MMTRRGLLLAAFAPPGGEMVRLAGGTFRMGSNAEDLMREFPEAGQGMRSMLMAETPRHSVTIPPFWMDRREVTNAQFQKFVTAKSQWSKKSAGAGYLENWDGDQFPRGQEDFPVVFVTWQAAQAYADWAGKRLPTEAEWEFAACGGREGAKYPWGNEAPEPRLANYSGSGKNGPVRAGSHPPNPYGLYDLAGNVWEFCLDGWSNYPSGAVTQTAAEVQRKRTAKAERRVIRGGSFGGGAFNMRVTARDSHRADNPVGHVGFRCARSA